MCAAAAAPLLCAAVRPRFCLLTVPLSDSGAAVVISPVPLPPLQCKHQLACLLASALRVARVRTVSDVEMAQLLEQAGELGPLLER